MAAGRDETAVLADCWGGAGGRQVAYKEDGGGGTIIGSSNRRVGSGGLVGAGRRRPTHENRNPFLIDNFF